jgi:hypothetical protein
MGGGKGRKLCRCARHWGSSSRGRGHRPAFLSKKKKSVEMTRSGTVAGRLSSAVPGISVRR